MYQLKFDEGHAKLTMKNYLADVSSVRLSLEQKIALSNKTQAPEYQYIWNVIIPSTLMNNLGMSGQSTASCS